MTKRSGLTGLRPGRLLLERGMRTSDIDADVFFAPERPG